jgi:DNA polymerase III epsilon subunit-like protein
MTMRALQQESGEWCRAVRSILPPFHNDYVVLDMETSGLDPTADLVLQFGCVIVRAGKIVHTTRAYLNWVQPGFITEETLRNKMASVAAHMMDRGSAYRLSYDTVIAEGQDPRFFLPALLETLHEALANGLAIVGHNLVAYDLVMLSRLITQVTGSRLLVGTGAVWDTGMLEKGRQMRHIPSMYENQIQWFNHIANARRRIKWKLDGWCSDVYDLWAKSGLDPTAAHDALGDAVLTHYLYQSIKELIESA